MEKDSPSKPSVAELAGRFKSHILPMPTSNDELSFRRRPPCSLKLQHEKDDNEESDKSVVSPKPFKIKMKNSSIIEKLQANLALSPTALLPSPKSPEVKLQPAPSSSPPTSRSPPTPLSPTLRPSHQSSEEEDPISFDSPPEGAPLPSINKTRARLSFKRRPPTRQHRRSCGEESGAFGSGLSPTELSSPEENGDKDQVLDSPAEEAERNLKETEDRDCEKTEDKVATSDPHDEAGPEDEQKPEQAPNSEASEKDQEPPEPCTTEQIEGDVKAEEQKPEEAQQEGDEEA